LLQRLIGQPARRPPDDVLDELIALYEEVERYWASGAVGPHMRLWSLSVGRPSS
jgi:hypothetical protein